MASRRPGRGRAVALALYGALSYVASLASFYVVFVWLAGPTALGVALPLGFHLDDPAPPASAATFVWNTAIMVAFALYHSIFARTVIKTRTRRLIGRHLERVTYNLMSAVLAVLLCLLWRPMPGVVWEAPTATLAQAIVAAYVGLWIVHLASIVLMDHHDFFGLRQVGLAMRGEPFRPLPPISHRYYLWTRLTLVISLALIPWAAPVITVGRLHFALFMTAYIALGAWLSNRDPGDVATVPAVATSEDDVLRLTHRA
jgi:hypothetical protein